jgi:hypothetical protein
MSIIIDDVKPTEEYDYIGYDFYLKDSSNEVTKYQLILENRTICCEDYNVEVIEGDIEDLIGNELVSVTSKSDDTCYCDIETYEIRYCSPGDSHYEYKSVYIKMYNDHNGYYLHEYKDFYYNGETIKESSGEM